MNRLSVLLLTIAFAGAAAQQATAPRQQKVLKDPAEYKAYMSAISQTDPNAKAQALETFLQQYPNTVIQEETLEQLLTTYMQLANNPTTDSSSRQGVLAGSVSTRNGIVARRVVDTANSLFYLDPDNLRAIAVLVVDKQAQAKFLGSIDRQQVARLRRDAAELAKRGLGIIASTPQSATIDYNSYDLTKLFNTAIATSNDPSNK